MALYAARRVLALTPVLLGISLATFALVKLVPGDVAGALLGDQASPSEVAELRRQLGLDAPLHVQFTSWLGRVVVGDLGHSIQRREPVTALLLERLPNTAMLTAAALAVSATGGVLAGIVSAARPRSLLDRAVMILSLLGTSMPVFWLGILLIVLFSVQLRWLPAGGMFSLREGPSALATLQHLVLPALTLGLVSIGVIARLTRSAMLDALVNDYVRTARGKGLREGIVLWRHAFRNAALPVVTILGAQVGFLLGGAVLTETVFAWPGVGLLMYQAITARDLPLIQGGVLFTALGFGLVNLVVDLAYGYLDPRIRLGRA